MRLPLVSVHGAPAKRGERCKACTATTYTWYDDTGGVDNAQSSEKEGVQKHVCRKKRGDATASRAFYIAPPAVTRTAGKVRCGATDTWRSFVNVKTRCLELDALVPPRYRQI